jgi:hypothetical protein
MAKVYQPNSVDKQWRFSYAGENQSVMFWIRYNRNLKHVKKAQEG